MQVSDIHGPALQPFLSLISLAVPLPGW